MREAPWSWLAAVDAGYPKAAWPLVRSLDLMAGHIGAQGPGLPDPRVRPEVRGVTHLDLGWYHEEWLAELVENLDHWENLRSVETGGITELDRELIAKLADAPALT